MLKRISSGRVLAMPPRGNFGSDTGLVSLKLPHARSRIRRLLTGWMDAGAPAHGSRFWFREHRWWSVQFLSFCALAAIVFHHYAGALFYRYDGTFILAMVKAQSHWMASGLGFSMNFLEGLGDLWIPTATSLIPGFVVGNLIGDDRLMPVAACFIFAAEFFLATVVLARCLGAGRLTAIAASWLGALVTLPFFVPTLDAWRIWGNPHFMTAIAVNALALCLFMSVGRAKAARDAVASIAILALLSYLVISQPVRAVIAAPMLAFFGFAALLGADDRRERLSKIISATAISGLFLILYGRYLFALFYHAKTTYFWDDLPSFPVNWRQQSFLISEGRGYGPFVWGACLAGAALAVIREHGRLRWVAIAFLAFVALQQLLFWIASAWGMNWGGPPTAYIDMFALPLYALFGGYLVIGWWGERLRNQRWVATALSIAPWGVLLSLHSPLQEQLFRQQNPFAWPPGETAITRYLQEEIGLREGALFRGRVANIAGTEFEPQYAGIPFISQHNYDGAISYHTGNDHRYYGLWYYSIPTLIEDNQFSSPFLHLLSSRLLRQPNEKDVRQFTTLTRFNPRILALLGVRFVISNKKLPGIEPATTFVALPEHPEGWTLFVYELPDANTAGYWSTRPMQAESVRPVLQWMAEGPENAIDAAVYEPVPGPLVDGGRHELRVYRDRLEVEAESAGASLLVLPVEFSHCLDLRSKTGHSARLLRANLNQAALAFSGQVSVELRYRYGPFHTGCRFSDIEDARKLRLREAGRPE